MTDWLDRPEPIERVELPVIDTTIGSPGAKGQVYVVTNDICYKEYFAPVDEVHLDRLIKWRRALNDYDRRFLDLHCAWPLRRVLRDGLTMGFLMRLAPDEFWIDMLGERHTIELQHLIHSNTAERLGVPVPSSAERLMLVRSLAEVFAFFDAHQMIYGDISEKNVLWTTRSGQARVFLIDCDNARPTDVVDSHQSFAMSRSDNWRDPTLGRDSLPDRDSDRFALAMFYYRAFYGVTAAVDHEKAIVLLPSDAPELPVLERLLIGGLAASKPRPAAQAWVTAIDTIDPVTLTVRQPQPAVPVQPVGSTATSRTVPHRPAPPGRAYGSRRTAKPRNVPSSRGMKRWVGGTLTGLIVLLLAVRVGIYLWPKHQSPNTPAVALSQVLGSWAAGPEKIDVIRYQTFVGTETNNTQSWGWVYLRVSINNASANPLDLSGGTQSMVLVLDKVPSFPSRPGVAAKAMTGLPDGVQLDTIGFQPSWTVTDGGVTDTIGWSAGVIPADQAFSPDDPAKDSAIYQLPPPDSTTSPAQASSIVDPSTLHILGVALLGADGRPVGFTPVSAWTVSNSFTDFVAP